MQEIVETVEGLVEGDYKGGALEAFIGELQKGNDTVGM